MKDNQIVSYIKEVGGGYANDFGYRHAGKHIPIEIWSEITDQHTLNTVTNMYFDAWKYGLKNPYQIRNSGGRTYLVTTKGKSNERF